MRASVDRVVREETEVSLSLTWEEFETLRALARCGVMAPIGSDHGTYVKAGDSLFGVTLLSDPKAIIDGLERVRYEARAQVIDRPAKVFATPKPTRLSR